MLHEGVPVLRVVPGSPAAQAGVQPAEVLDGGGREARQADRPTCCAAVDAKKAKDKLALQPQGAGGGRARRRHRSAETPQEIPLNDPSLPLQQGDDGPAASRWRAIRATETAAFARLNLAICAMHFGDFAAAHEHPAEGAGGAAGSGPGLSQGTAPLLPRAWPWSGSATRRRRCDAYRAAAGFKDATLFNNDGPAVAPLAARRAANL